MAASAQIFCDELAKKSGLKVEPFLAKDYMALIDGIASKKIDIAFINSLGYLLAQDWSRAEAVFQLMGENGKLFYRSGIITRNDTGIKTVEDINGRTFVYSDPFSMAGYLMPLYVFNQKKITPKSTSFAGNYDGVIEMVHNGLINAGAIYFYERDPDGRIHDARLKLVNKYPDMIDNIPVIFTSDPIPTPPIAFRKDLTPGLKENLKRTLQVIGVAPSVTGALNAMYDAKGLAPANPKSYDSIREILKTLGKDVQEVVPGAVDFYKKHLWEVVPGF